MDKYGVGRYTPGMRWLGALLVLASLAAAQAVSPVVALLLRHLTQEQVQALGGRPTLRAAAVAVPSDRRDAVAAELKKLEASADFQTFVELTSAYLHLAHPEEADRVSRLAQAANPGVEGLAFRAWAAQQAGDNAAAEQAAREGLRLDPSRKDLHAILKLTEGRSHRGAPAPVSLPAEATAPVPEKPAPSPATAGRDAERVLAEAVRARNVGDLPRAIQLVRRAVQLDPSSQALKELLSSLESASQGQSIQATMAVIRKSKTGAAILDAAAHANIRFEVLPGMPSNVMALYHPDTGRILLPPSFFSEPPMAQAIVLSHEAYHAVQRSSLGSAVTLETEKAATLRAAVVWYELRGAGVSDVPGSNMLRSELDLFGRAVSEDDIRLYLTEVSRKYEDDADARHQAAVAVVPKVIRPAVSAATRYTPAFHNGSSARELQGSLWGRILVGRKRLRRVQLQYADEIRWYQQWRTENGLP